MRKMLLIAAAILMTGSFGAYAQQKSAPAKAQGAGADCSRMTDAKARDECVRQAQQKSGATSGKANDSKSKGGNAKDTAPKSKGKN